MKTFFYNLNLWQTRVRCFFSTETYLHAERFALPHELVDFSSKKPDDFGLLLGIDAFGRYLQITQTKKRKRLGNLLLCAPTGGGKTTDFKHQLVHWKGSAIVNDNKGDLYADTADPRREFSDVYSLDFQGGGNQFDPLLGKHTVDDFYATAQLLLYEPNEREPSFTQRGMEIVKMLFLAARIAGIPVFVFLYEVAHLGINGLAKRIHAISPQLATSFLDGEYIPTRDYRDAKYLVDSWASARARLQPFLTEVVAKTLSRSDFRITDLLTGDRPITLYLQTPESKLSALAPIRTLLWGTFINELNTTYDALYKKHGPSFCSRLQKILFLIDEAGVTPIPELYKHVATVNGRGMSFVLGIQALSQLEMYGKANAETILNNCTQVFFQQKSLETAKYVSELLGGRSAFSSSQSRHGEETSEGKHEQKVPLMTPQEIRGMGETILIFDRDVRYAIKAKRMPEFVKPEPSLPLLPVPKRAPETLPNDVFTPRFPIPLYRVES
jgi:type IV secretion system protein VirD4